MSSEGETEVDGIRLAYQLIGRPESPPMVLLHASGERGTAPTLLIGGGADSHIPQDKLIEAANRIPRCDIVTIAAGHHVHSSRPSQFVRAALGWIQA